MDPSPAPIPIPSGALWRPEMLLLQPRNFEQVQEAVVALQQHKTVLLNLTELPLEEAQRAADFVAGATYALDGHQEALAELVFLFAPHHVVLSREP